MAKRRFLSTVLTLGMNTLFDLTKVKRSGRDAASRRGGRAAALGRGSRRARGGSAAAPIRPAAYGADGQFESTATIEVDPRKTMDLRLEYAPRKDGDPDAGEIVWTWVPYAENDGRGKDRPVLVIARHTTGRVFAVKLTSKDKSGRDDRLGIGAGPWDSSGRPSWVDTDQLYSVHHDGLRREAAALDLDRFTSVAAALQVRFGCTVR